MERGKNIDRFVFTLRYSGTLPEREIICNVFDNNGNRTEQSASLPQNKMMTVTVRFDYFIKHGIDLHKINRTRLLVRNIMKEEVGKLEIWGIIDPSLIE